ncbi:MULTISPECIES: molybdate ABC transporter substrate-binding protein [unclassified Cohnella]|uniref:molybdate ABC transporter substrate-binding protein n=1 Tax=Cohnella sp. OV330 TaxID=1855288 RepID=UPI000B7D4C88
MRLSAIWIVCLAIVFGLSACGGTNNSKGSPSASASSSSSASASESALPSALPSASGQASPTAEETELTVSAAASLTDALGELKALYENAHPNVTLSFNFGASGALQQQIEQGAPADLFLSAATKNMQALVDKGLMQEQRDLLKNELVVVVPSDAQSAVAKLEDLSSDAVKKIAVGIPESVPAGGYAKDALTAAGLWDSLRAKLVQGKDVRQVLQYVETANADAGFVYKTDALSSDKVKVAFAVDPSQYKPIVYPVGVVKATKHAAAAESFYAYLQTPEAIAVFVKYGFSAAVAE